MARPKSFNRDEALDHAIQRFRAHGYDGTSADDLVRDMGIARQSLYDTFGNKKDLYLEALRAYNGGNVGEIIQILREERSPLAALRRVLLAPAMLTAEEREMGCFGINAICEFGVSDRDVLAAGEASRLALDAAMEALIAEAQRKGEITTALSVQAVNNYIGCVVAGLKVAGRAGAPADAMKQIAETALLALKPNP